MARPTFRVHIVTHHDGRRTGWLLASFGQVDSPPSAYGDTDAQVFSQLTLALEERQLDVDAFLWDTEVELRKVTVAVHPQRVVKRRHVIGKEEIRLQVSYACSKEAGGGYRVLVPRFGWWFVLEDLTMAPGVIKQAVSSALLGEAGGSLYGFRAAAQERVVAWSPTLSRGRRKQVAKVASDAMSTVHAVAEELVGRARKRRGKPVVGHIEVERYLPLVLRENPRSLLLVGPSGVGKTTWLRALARRISKLDASEQEFIPRIWSTSADRIVAGMAYLGQWEQRCVELVRELSGEGDLLYVGDLPGLVRPRSGRTSIADMLLPAVRDGELSLVCECDENTLERLSARYPALLGQFVHVRIKEPSASMMPRWLDEYQSRVMKNTRIGPEGLRRLVQHLDLFQRDAGFPGKGIRFVDWLAAEQGSPDTAGAAGNADVTPAGAAPPAGALELPSGSEPSVTMLSADAVSEAYARASGLPLEIISDAHRAGLAEITARLEQGVVGQGLACRTAARVVTRLKAGLNDPARPVGSLFFVGPTGVGKTELAKQLARYLFGDAERMIRLDMSEYMMPGSSQRMLAVGRGVSSLVERVRQTPLSLILLDEIEKAHPEVFDLLLAMLGEGRMTDTEGHLVDFSMAIVVMTSNLGVRRTGAPGFSEERQDDGVGLVSQVRKHFRPEFFNRIDHVVPFSALTRQDIVAVVDLELAKAAKRSGFVRRGITLQACTETKEALAVMGYHPTRGARPLRRVIEERIIGPLAVLLAAEPALHGRTAHLVVAEGDEQRRLAGSGALVITL